LTLLWFVVVIVVAAAAAVFVVVVFTVALQFGIHHCNIIVNLRFC